VYPAAFTLFSQQTLVASLVTPVIYLLQTPEKPIRSSVAVPSPRPIAFVATTRSSTRRSGRRSRGGSLREILNAISASASGGIRAAPSTYDRPRWSSPKREQSPTAYQTSDGTQAPAEAPERLRATRFLDELTSVVGATRNVETVAQPFGNPHIPSMLATYSGFPTGETPTLETQLDAQRTSGIAVISSLNTTPSPRCSPERRQFNGETLDWLARSSLDVAIGAADTSIGRPGRARPRPRRPCRPRPAPRSCFPIPTPRRCSTERTSSQILCSPRRRCWASSRSSGSRSRCPNRRIGEAW
jgi:hypothetical protein